MSHLGKSSPSLILRVCVCRECVTKGEKEWLQAAGAMHSSCPKDGPGDKDTASDSPAYIGAYAFRMHEAKNL